MKILFVAPGASTHTIRWINRAKDLGHEVVLYSQDGVVAKATFTTIVPDATISKIKNPIHRLIKDIKHLNKVLRTEKPDIIHIHWFFSPVALATSFIKKIPILGTPWGSDLLYTNEKEAWNKKKWLIYRFSIWKVVRNIDFFTCDALHLKKALIKFGAKEYKINIIYFGTDCEEFTPKKRSNTLRKTWGVNDNTIVLLSNRNLFKVYDIETVIKSFSVVEKIRPNTLLLIGGQGPEREKLLNQVVNLGLTKKVNFLGALENEDFISTVASADIYISSSTSDGGLASSIAEAMASQLPVVITDFGENLNWLNENSTGLSFKIGDWQKLAELLVELIDNANLRLTLGLNARKMVKAKLNPKNEGAKLEALYSKIS